MGKINIKKNLKDVNLKINTKPKPDEYDDIINKTNTETNIAENFYDIATDFYMYGWGDCFHFARLKNDESFNKSILNHELNLAKQIGINENSKVMDLGCGVGGPLKNIASNIKCSITGLTINQYQVEKGNEILKKESLDNKNKIILGDYLKLPFDNNSFDNGIDIEATAHCTDLNKYFSEVCI